MTKETILSQERKLENEDPFKMTEELEISPKDFLKFKGPFDRNMTQEFVLTNKTGRLGFKIKSNAPKNRLVVSPHIGIVEPGQSIVHKVTLSRQTLRGSDNPPPSYAILVQAVPVGPDVVNIKDAWTNISLEDKIRTMRLECVYEENDQLIRKPHRRVTLPGRLVMPPSLDNGPASSVLHKGILVTPTDALTVAGQQSNGSAAGGGGDKVFQFQPVIQPPNTATVVFNSDNLGELEILNNNKQGTKPGDTNNNSGGNQTGGTNALGASNPPTTQAAVTGGPRWAKFFKVGTKPGDTNNKDGTNQTGGTNALGASNQPTTQGAATDGWGNTADDWNVQLTTPESVDKYMWDNLRADNNDTATAAATTGATESAGQNDEWNPPIQQAGVEPGWNDQQHTQQPPPVGNQDGWSNDVQQPGIVGGNAGGWDPNNPADDGWDRDHQVASYPPAPPIAGVDEHIKTMFAVAMAAIAVFLFGLILGKAGL